MADFTRPTHRVETIIYIVARKVGGLPFACRRSWRVNQPRSMKTVSKTNRAEGDGGFRSPSNRVSTSARSRVDNSKNCIPVTSGFRSPLINKFRYRYRYRLDDIRRADFVPQTIETLSILAISSIPSNERFWLESFRTRVDVDANLSPRVRRGAANPPP